MYKLKKSQNPRTTDLILILDNQWPLLQLRREHFLSLSFPFQSDLTDVQSQKRPHLLAATKPEQRPVTKNLGSHHQAGA